MPTITLKNVPMDVHIALQQRAKRHNHSLNQEAIICLKQALGRENRDPQKLLEGIRNLRSRISMKPVSLDWIDKAKRNPPHRLPLT
ncbi:MAG: hypothetical protein WCD79_14070 [Chthoniobacteraceae bacterium]